MIILKKKSINLELHPTSDLATRELIITFNKIIKQCHRIV